MISNKKYYITVALLVILAIGTYFGGLKMGSKGYAYSGTDFKVVNQNNAPKNVDYNLLWQALDVINTKYIDKPVDQQKVLYGAISGAVSALGDPYTTFFTPQQFSNFKTQLAGNFDGIGAEVGAQEGQLVIIAPLDDAPAKRAGLMAGDVILKIDGADASQFTLDEAVSKIRGRKGTKVVLNIYRPSTKKTQDYTITRDTIEIKSVKSQIKDINGKKIAVISITEFGDDTVDRFKTAANEALQNKVDGIVIDLRDDPGGYLDAAVSIASYWVNPGDVVVSEKHSDGSSNDYKATGNNTLAKIPTVVMINGGSASASEILTGALHDHGFAKTVGVKSFGKGSVQELINLPQSTAVKVTVAKWYTPNGVNINKNGLEPDTKVDLTADDITAKRDPQLDKALEQLTK